LVIFVRFNFLVRSFTPKVLGVDCEFVTSNEPDEVANNFVEACRIKSGHHFLSISAATAGSGQCTTHGKRCEHPSTRVDILVIGIPCDPFSDQNPNRWKKTSEQIISEERVASILKGFLSMVRLLKPRMVIFENVPGITKGVCKKRKPHLDPSSPIDLIMGMIHQEFSDYYAKVVRQDCDEHTWSYFCDKASKSISNQLRWFWL